MGNFLQIIWLVITIILAFVGMSIIFNITLARIEVPNFLKGVIGSIIGIIIESLRRLLAFGVLSLFTKEVIFTSGLAAFLATFSFGPIPILVGIGFFAGQGVRKIKKYKCPNCGKSFNLEEDKMANNIESDSESEDPLQYKEPCTYCKAILAYDIRTYDIISFDPPIKN